MKAACLLLALALGGPLLVRAAEADEAERGRALYQGWTPYAAGPAATPLRLAPDLLACARCHGVHGEGGREGGQVVPALRWSALTQPREGRPAFDGPDALVQALAQGRGRGGQALGAAMPRFTLTAQEATALLAYLQRLGTDADQAPGVEPQVLHLGTIVPLSGPAAAAGSAIVAGLRAGIDQTNAQGGIHGRRISLHVRDARQGAPAALRRLRAEQPVFALVGGLWNESAEPMDATLAAARVSHIGALVAREQPPRADAWSADLLAPLAEQRRGMVDALRDCAQGPRVALSIGAARASAPDAAVPVRWIEADARIDSSLVALTEPAGCLAYSPAQGPAVQRALSPGWSRTLVLPMPAELFAAPQAEGTLQPWHRLGWTAARLAVELLSRAGRQLHERDLLAQLGGMNEWEVAPGLTVHYGRVRRHGWDAGVLPLGVSTTAAPARLAARVPQ